MKGDGSVYQVASGRWRAALVMPDGRRAVRQAADEKRALRLLDELRRRRDLDVDPSRLTLGDYLRSWLDSLERRGAVRATTMRHYRLACSHVEAALGGVRLDRLTPRMVQRMVDDELSARDAGGKPLHAPQTVRHHHAVLRRALNVAVRQRVIPWNPALAVELPDRPAPAGEPLTADEARRLLAATEGNRLHPLWRLALVTGLRQAELLGLGWDDVGDGGVTVRAQLQRIGGAWVRVPPKAARAVETVAIDAATIEVLRRHEVAMASERTAEWRYPGLVFTTSTGEPYHNAEVLKAFHLALKHAGVAPRRFHDLRHSSATIMRDLGVAEDTRMARLGHSTTAMSRRYAHASGSQDRMAAEALAEAIG